MSKSQVETLKQENVKYVWHHWTSNKHYAERPLVLESAEGSVFRDIEGREYLDAVSGVYVVNIGYGRKEVINAMKTQMDKLAYNCLVYSATESTITAAKKLAAFAPGNLKKVYFVTGGSEATETALKMSRQYQVLQGALGKYRVIGRWMSYHGCTLGALSATGHTVRRKMFEPMLANFPHISAPYCYRCPYGKEPDECDLECARELERTIKAEGEHSVSAFIAEPIGGLTAGTLVPPGEYLKIIREICSQHNVLFIADEVLVGFGRTGRNFAVEHSNVVPDLMVLGKGITSGYAPEAAVLTSPEFTQIFDDHDSTFHHGHTFGGSPVASAAVSAVIDITVKEKLSERADEVGRYFIRRLKELEKHRIVGDVRGIGLIAAVELVKNRETKSIFGPTENVAAAIASRMLEKGVKIFGTKGFDTGMVSDFLALAPPLIITREQIDRIVSVMDECIGEAERQL